MRKKNEKSLARDNLTGRADQIWRVELEKKI